MNTSYKCVYHEPVARILLCVVLPAIINFFENFGMHRIEGEIIGANRNPPAILENTRGLPARPDARNQRQPGAVVTIM